MLAASIVKFKMISYVLLPLLNLEAARMIVCEKRKAFYLFLPERGLRKLPALAENTNRIAVLALSILCLK